MLFVANWKMFFTTSEAIAFFARNRDGYAELVQGGAEILVCPSLPALAPLKKITEEAGIALGAQSYMPFERGAYTGCVGVDDLVDLGCGYCLVGHSEQRLYCGETDDDVARKAVILACSGITPIVCIGENRSEREEGLTQQVIINQLTKVFAGLARRPTVLYVAYEPVWAIGTGLIPTAAQIEEVFCWIEEIALSYSNVQLHLLYGGSVSAKNSLELCKIPNLAGFLIGKASLDFQEFEKIVHCSF